MPWKTKTKNPYRRKTRRSSKRVATKSYVRKAVQKQHEIKFFDYTQSAVSIDYAGTAFYPITLVPQGDSDSTRDGDKLYIKGARIRFTFTYGDATNFVRVIVAQYRGNVAIGSPAVSTILQSAYFGSGAIVAAPYAHDYRQIWTILADKRVSLSSAARPNALLTIKPRMKYCKRQLDYIATTTTHANGLYLLFVSDSAAVPHPTVTFVSRLWYTDG